MFRVSSDQAKYSLGGITLQKPLDTLDTERFRSTNQSHRYLPTSGMFKSGVNSSARSLRSRRVSWVLESGISYLV
jgi:hypothetical protein